MTWTWGGHTFDDAGGREIIIHADLGRPELRAQRVLLPQNHGGVAGDDWAGMRRIEVELFVEADTAIEAEDAFDAWNARMQPASTDEPLTRTRADGTTRTFFVRPEPAQLRWLTEREFTAKLRWEAADSAEYGPLTQTQVDPYVGTTLASYPETWPTLGDYPKLYGSGGSGGGVTVSNDGKWHSWPRFLIDGPSSGTMSVTSLEDVTNGKSIQFTANGGLTVPSGSTLVVDTDPARRLVAFTDGASRMDRVTDLDSWWALQPGDTEVRFRAGGDTDGATATVQARSAWL